jgi:hypothetical protein
MPAAAWVILVLIFGGAAGAAIAMQIVPVWLGVGAAAAAGLALGVFVIRPIRRGR